MVSNILRGMSIWLAVKTLTRMPMLQGRVPGFVPSSDSRPQLPANTDTRGEAGGVV